MIQILMGNRKPHRMATKPLTLTLEQLEDWLGDCDPPRAGVSKIDGYLAALIVSPEFLPPERWSRPIIGDDVIDAPDRTLEGAARNTLFQRYNQISSNLSGGAKRYVPIFMRTDDEEVLLENYANGFWFGMQLTLDKWKPFISDRNIGVPLVAILGQCTTMTSEDNRLANLDPLAAEALAVSCQVAPEVVEVLHKMLAGSRNIEIR